LTGLLQQAETWAGNKLRETVTLAPLAGDGGQRQYFRLRERGLMLLHGPDAAENLAWLRIGRHLWFKGLPLPRIYDFDLTQGFFLLEDLGDAQLAGPTDMTARYPEAARILARFHLRGAEGFNPAWGHQTRAYDANMATEQEVQYYLRAFITGYCGLPFPLPSTGKPAAWAIWPRPSRKSGC
jgi:aminoglycoside/choline kinase family phosphotransferase